MYEEVFFFYKYVLEMFWLFKENHVKIKNTECICMFSCDIIEISNW